MPQTAAHVFQGPIGACGARRWDRPSPSSRKRSVAGRAIDDGPASAYYLPHLADLIIIGLTGTRLPASPPSPPPPSMQLGARGQWSSAPRGRPPCGGRHGDTARSEGRKAEPGGVKKAGFNRSRFLEPPAKQHSARFASPEYLKNSSDFFVSIRSSVHSSQFRRFAQREA